jgi:hypothetical protein
MNAITNHGSALRLSPFGRALSSALSLRDIHMAVIGTSNSSPNVRMNLVSPAIATTSSAWNCCA